MVPLGRGDPHDVATKERGSILRAWYQPKNKSDFTTDLSIIKIMICMIDGMDEKMDRKGNSVDSNSMLQASEQQRRPGLAGNQKKESSRQSHDASNDGVIRDTPST